MTQRAQTMVELADELEKCPALPFHALPNCKLKFIAGFAMTERQRDMIVAALRSVPAPGGIEAREAAGGRLTFCETCNTNRFHRRAKIVDGIQTFECNVCAAPATLQSQTMQPAGKGEEPGMRQVKAALSHAEITEHNNRVAASAVRPDAPVGVKAALEHALVRFKCLEDHFKEIGDEALWAMSSVDADRMRKALAPVRGDSSDARAAIQQGGDK